MDKQYFYKIKDVEDDRYSIYLCTDTECYSLLEKTIQQCREDNKLDESLIYYINENLTNNNIKYSIIKWNVLEF